MQLGREAAIGEALLDRLALDEDRVAAIARRGPPDRGAGATRSAR